MDQQAHPLIEFASAGDLPDARGLVERILNRRFPRHDTSTVRDLFGRVGELFVGRHPGYRGCDVPYHDLSHTCRVTVCTAQILDGHACAATPPQLGPRDFEMAIAAALLHDSGYLKAAGDGEGTGAKYTFVHVDRGVALAAEFLPPFGMTPDEIRTIQQAIRCTGYDVDMDAIRFRGPRERYLGCAVGTADMLGQLAAPDYPERLADLHREFAEAHEHASGGVPPLKRRSVRDLMSGTREFYDRHVTRLLDIEWDGVHRDLRHHFKNGTNPYHEAIAFNLERIDRLLARRLR